MSGRNDNRTPGPIPNRQRTPDFERYNVNKVPTLKDVQVARKHLLESLYHQCNGVGRRATDDIMKTARKFVMLAAASSFSDTHSKASTWTRYTEERGNGWFQNASAIFPDSTTSALWSQHYKALRDLNEAARHAVLHGLKIPAIRRRTDPPDRCPSEQPSTENPRKNNNPTSSQFIMDPWDAWNPVGLKSHDNRRNRSLLQKISRHQPRVTDWNLAALDVFIVGLTRALQLLTSEDPSVFVVSPATAKNILERMDARNTDWRTELKTWKGQQTPSPTPQP